MWKRKDLKSKARQVLKKNYWTILVVCFILALVTSEYGMSTNVLERNDESLRLNWISPTYTVENNSPISDTVKTILKEQLNSATKSTKYVLKINDAIHSFTSNSTVYGIALCIGAGLGILFIIFIAQPLIVGGRRFFTIIREDSKAKVSIILTVFRKGEWGNISKIMLIRSIYIILWFLTIIGGFIKIYEYRMIPFLLGENPNMKTKEVFKMSRQMMKGNKWRAFVLDLSFIGWNILSVFTLGLVSVLFLNPYMATTNTELYLTLKQKAIKEKFENYKSLNNGYVLELDDKKENI